MTCKNWFLILGLLYWAGTAIAQRDDIVLTKEKKEFAFNSIKELKEGALVVRLKTNHRKIEILERTLRNPKLTKQQRKRHENILAGTIKQRDGFNKAIAKMFMDSFRFCSVYLMYDTCTQALNNGTREGIFLDENHEYSSSITLKESHVFIINYKKKSAEFPFDILRMRKLKEKLEDPFPYYAAIRESWVNQVNAPRASQAVVQLDRRLHKFYDRALDYDDKMQKRAARKAANSNGEKSVSIEG